MYEISQILTNIMAALEKGEATYIIDVIENKNYITEEFSWRYKRGSEERHL